MSFGLRKAAQTFQRLMDMVTYGLSFVCVCLHDILIFSKSKEEHMERIRELFCRLQKHGLVTSAAKCQCGVDEIDFLGHRVNRHDVFLLPEKVEAVRSFTKLDTVEELE